MIATLPELKPVKSSRFSHVGFDDETFTLFIRFHPTKTEPRGALYSYANFSEEELTDFFNAESLGKYFAANLLKNPEHPFTRVAEDAPQAAADEPVYVMNPVPEVPEDQDELKLQALAVVDQVKALAIVSPAEYSVAGNELVRLREMKKKAQERVDRLRVPAFRAYQATLELQRDVMGPYDEAEAFLDRGMAGYRQRERDERLRLEAEENRKRREAAEAEQKRVQAELAERDAKVAEAQGRPQEAEQIRQQPLPMGPVRVQAAIFPKAVPKVAGIVERAPVWKWRPIPGQQHLVPEEYKMLNEQAISAAVRTQKNLTNIAGIEVWDEEAKVAVKAGK
jgi:hypothetical protein